MMAGLQFSAGWRWAFYIQSIILFPNILILLYVPAQYMDINGTGKRILDFRKKQRLLRLSGVHDPEVGEAQIKVAE